MKISSKAWKSYIDRLGRIDNKAAELASNYYSENPDASMEELIGYCVSVADYYGSAAGELACEMYDEVAETACKIIPPAEPARTATYGEVASAIQSALLRSQNPEAVGAVVSNKVKTVGLDTLLNNSLRDGAEFAWVPSGDTCAFCIMLASNGWQRASKKALKNGHAEHVHNNCNCTYAIRFDEDTEVEGYDPEYYKDLYDNADGKNWKDKVNYMRRKQRENPVIRDKINAQQRAAYAERERLKKTYNNNVPLKALDAEGFKEKFIGLTESRSVDSTIYEEAVKMLKHRTGTDYEDFVLIDMDDGSIISTISTSKTKFAINYDKATLDAIDKAKRNNRRIIAMHNHPNGLPPSLDDGVSALVHGYERGIVVGNNLEVYQYTRADRIYPPEVIEKTHGNISKVVGLDVDFDENIWYNTLEEFGMSIRRL